MNRREEPSAVVVLIAEDEAAIAEVVAFVVEDAGYTPLVARHGQHALELARTRWPTLLITDLMMPHLTGAQLIAALRVEAAATGQGRVPAILMTAAHLHLAHRAGADAVLPKPFNLDDLQLLLGRILQQRGSHPEG